MNFLLMSLLFFCCSPMFDVFDLFENVKCVEHDKYRCKREDGKWAEFSGLDCDWIYYNMMKCALKKPDKPTIPPKPTYTTPTTTLVTFPVTEAQTTEPEKRCACENVVRKFYYTKCIGLNYYICKRDDGKMAKFEASDCDCAIH